MVSQPQLQIVTTENEQYPLERMSLEAFLSREEEVYAEWVDGEVHQLTAPSDLHQQIVTFLTTLMTIYAVSTGAGTVRVAPFLVHLANAARLPDILFVATANLTRIRSNLLDGAPDIAVEVVSASTRQSDEHDKFHEYETAGVQEYWLLDPERQRATFYRRDASGQFQSMALNEDWFESETLPGFRLNTALLWEQ